MMTRPIWGYRMRTAENVLIVGAGMCGMSLGVALKRAGITCEIVEIRPKLTEPGTGISLQGPALRALQSVGVLDQCISRGFGYSPFQSLRRRGEYHGHSRSTAPPWSELSRYNRRPAPVGPRGARL